MAVDPITAGLDLVDTLVKRFFPDKTAEEQAKMTAMLTVVQGQLAINAAEAANPNGFTSGWRPGIGWVCAAALAMQYIARPLLQWVSVLLGHPLPLLPGIDDNLWQLMLGILGLGGLRSYEKVKGVA